MSRKRGGFIIKRVQIVSETFCQHLVFRRSIQILQKKPRRTDARIRNVGVAWPYKASWSKLGVIDLKHFPSHGWIVMQVDPRSKYLSDAAKNHICT